MSTKDLEQGQTMSTKDLEQGADQASTKIEETLTDPSTLEDHLSTSAEELLSNPSTLEEFYRGCLVRVPDQLRKENETAYEPIMVAIGPYHHDKANLKKMESHKQRYLDEFLSRVGSVDEVESTIKGLEQEARNFYEETDDLDSDKFVKMMLLDGCFIVGSFVVYDQGIDRSFSQRKWKKKWLDVPFYQTVHFESASQHDLILLENQIPFFIVVELFKMIATPPEEIIRMALNFLQSIVIPHGKLQAYDGLPIDRVEHLLGLMYNCWCFPVALKSMEEKEEKSNESNNGKWKFINSATELQEAGVELKMVSRPSHSFDIKFKNGALEIPPLCITIDTESILTNLVAYELCDPGFRDRYVNDFVVFMDCLINTTKDVHLLRRSGIIESWLGDDAEVHTMWHKLFKSTVTYTDDFLYSKVFNELNEHCGHHRHSWMANLRLNYFNTPWAIFSVIAAAVLLLLTLTQTIFSILSFTQAN